MFYPCCGRRTVSGSLLEQLGRGCRGRVFTIPYTLCVLQGNTEEAGTPCSFSTSSFLEFSKRSSSFLRSLPFPPLSLEGCPRLPQTVLGCSLNVKETISYIHANSWIVQGWRSKARLKTPWQSNSGIQCIHDHPWTVQGWHSSQAQDFLAK